MKSITLRPKLDRTSTNFYKLLAAIMVVSSHYCTYRLEGNIEVCKVFEQVCSALFGKIGVAIFFLLSGYGLMKSYVQKNLSFRGFLRYRFSKIYLPALLAAIILEIILAISSPRDVSLFTDTFLLFNDSPMWFVRILLINYILFNIFVHSKFSKVTKIAIIVLYFFADLYLIGPYQAVNVPLFFMGCEIAMGGVKKVVILLVLLLMAYFSIYIVLRESVWLYCSIEYMAALFFILLTCFITIKITLPALINSATFDMYLVHNKIITVLAALNIYIGSLYYIVLLLILVSAFYLTRSYFLKVIIK